ncbi:hypothetical protein SAMN05421736_10384 [Evansella caseinilytica]|uniref:DUF503 domain-containing protein n=1 Tax=Evansella caseinilytica TaxID=1503961 RepID=A0A1H3M2I7_9BACI|nr:DUF503 domain-containing protein [Evansella caseinilytica]SDY70478.1 hypothetical protein SAMN05421736_10384 [Evansella caseinilytica]
MIIGMMTVEAILYEARSLKEKRSTLKSVITRIRQRYNVSITESNHQNVWQRAEWTIVAVGSIRIQTEKELQRALAIIDNHENLEISNVSWEWLL